MAEKSQFIVARENTETVLKKMVVYEDHMKDELNLLAKQALFSAKMEVFIANAENVPVEQLSPLAKRVYQIPDLAITKEFTLKELQTNFMETEKQKQTTMDAFGEKTAQKAASTGVNSEPFENEPRDEKPIKLTKTKVKRKWSIRQSIDVGECEIQIEILRPRMRPATTPAKTDDFETKIVDTKTKEAKLK